MPAPETGRSGPTTTTDPWLDSIWGAPPAAPQDVSQSLRALLLRLGPGATCACVTLLGVAVSLLVSLLVNALIHRTAHDLWVSLLMSAGIPLLIGPPLTWLVMSLLQDAETARRTAEQLAVTDPLTGAFNRRHFFIIGERRFVHSRRAQEQVSVLLLDIDDFKAINDRHGHAVGDRVLIEVARACKAGMRERDLLARYGGEEFVALLPAADLARALQVAERVRATVAAISIASDGGVAVRPTVSVGVAIPTVASASFDALLAQADSAMYVAKRSGKNRVSTHEPRG